MIAKSYAELIRKGLKTVDDIPLEKDREEVKKILGITDETEKAAGETAAEQQKMRWAR